MGKFRQFLTELSARDMSVFLFFFFFFFLFPEITSLNINGFSRSLPCALIMWRSALALCLGKFRQFWLSNLHATHTYFRLRTIT